IPPKRHTQFKKPDGSFYPEEIFGTEAFSGVYSTLYHNNLPTRVSHIKKLKDLSVAEWETDVHRHHRLRTKGGEAGGDAIASRQPLFFNEDAVISVSRPTHDLHNLLRYARGHTLYYI